MSQSNETTQEQPTKPTSGNASKELTEKELDTVSGGINPQPLPPHRPTNLD